MKWLPWCLGLCAIGVALFVAGLLWQNLLGDRLVWTEAQAEQFNQASAGYHQAAHAHADDHAHSSNIHLASSHGGSISDAELAAAKSQWQSLEAQLDAAIARRDFYRNLLRGSGMLCIVIGGLGYLAIKNASD